MEGCVYKAALGHSMRSFYTSFRDIASFSDQRPAITDMRVFGWPNSFASDFIWTLQPSGTDVSDSIYYHTPYIVELALGQEDASYKIEVELDSLYGPLSETGMYFMVGDEARPISELPWHDSHSDEPINENVHSFELQYTCPSGAATDLEYKIVVQATDSRQEQVSAQVIIPCEEGGGGGCDGYDSSGSGYCSSGS